MATPTWFLMKTQGDGPGHVPHYAYRWWDALTPEQRHLVKEGSAGYKDIQRWYMEATGAKTPWEKPPCT